MISILLATYNGAKYLSELLDSLFAQTIQDFTLYIYDDCSTDDTVRIIESYSREHPGRIIFTRRSSNSGSAKFSFLDMMTAHQDDYVMLCDQDDVWLPHKIELTLKGMKQAEQEHGNLTPLLIHTELLVTHEDTTQEIGQYHILANLDCSRISLNCAIVQNIAIGCTIMYNRALSQLIIKPCQFYVMHDWWLFLIASALGKIKYLEQETLLYRQHGTNSIGVSDTRTIRYILRRLRNSSRIRQALLESSIQADTFLRAYISKLTEKQKHLLKTYAEIPQMPKLKKITTLLKLQTIKNSLPHKIGQIIFI